MTLFYLSLIATPATLGIVLLQVRFIKHGAALMAGLALTLVAAHYADLPAAGLVVLLALVWAYCARRWNWRFRTLAMVTISTCVLAFGLISVKAYVDANDYRERRKRYAQGPLSQRLPTRNVIAAQSMATDTEKHLRALDDEMSVEMNKAFLRVNALRHLHERRLESFVNSPGFGVRRLVGVPTEERVKLPEMGTSLPQSGSLEELQWSDSDLARPALADAGASLFPLHRSGVIDFVNPVGFGFLSPDKQLYGFQPHHFRSTPKSEQWQVRSLALVSLLLHETPMVYASKNLPRMDQVRDIPVRPLDAFESAGLQKLQSGEELFIREAPGGLRVLGALRSVSDCIGCHGGVRGDLLGAFSYGIIRTRP